MNDITDDRELMRRIAEKDTDALEHVYDRYERAVYSFAYRIVHDTMTAEEVVQELFLRVWNNAERYDRSQGKLSTWMFTITRNIAVDMLRRKASRATTDPSGDEALQVLPDTKTNVQEQVSLNWERERIREAMMELREEQQQVIESIYFQGLTQHEVSEKFSIPLGTVKSRVRLAIRQLHNKLAEAVKGGNAYE
ncbi:RNA polymerase sigma factor [Paenibacillus wulumuqiensis]|uniref:RNA polymerase sigma factor n=1 Tax=Paenibacillus wulumuqiensis TaxID=1567107 RepID=UPI00061A07A9|nr:sigma-70 family RNA polymerase sigma factor [Paenibacillus wulumuqiensis]